jgi:signal transduction histidine kinase
LSIVKQFVELHGGRVSAESVVDEGTRVTIRLPRRHSCPEQPEDGEAPVLNGG